MIKNGKVVDLLYTLKNKAGEQLDRSTAEEPFTYLHGSGQIVPGLETALDGLKKGDKKAVTVAPEEGYGEHNPGLQLEVNRSQFPEDAELTPGVQFQTRTPEGYGMVFRVEKLEGDMVHINGNHPLAGETLFFDVEVLDIRDATAEELEHGHAHGADGHEHDHDHDHDHGDDSDGHGHSH